MEKYLDKDFRIKIIKDIKSPENISRKKKSYKEFDCYMDNLKRYVDDAIVTQFSAKTKSMMPVVASINLVKRIIDQQSTIYLEPPERVFIGTIDDDQVTFLRWLYKDLGFDSKSLKAERIFNLQNQTHVYFRIVNNRILMQPIYAHNLDVVESSDNPEEAEAYIISNFDKSDMVASDKINQIIADNDDFKKSLERYTIWTEDYNFVFDGNGDIVGDPEDVYNPLGIIPIVEVSNTKDFTYFPANGSNLINFCIDYNVALSDLMFISRLQGFAQGVISGDKEVLDKMTSVEFGAAHIIKLANSPDGNPTKMEFIQRGSDIQGSIQAIEVLLSTFLTSKGIDPKVVTGKGDALRYSSGIERLLAMVERFEAAKSSFDLFQNYEMRSLEIIKAILNTYNGNRNVLDPRYFISLPDDLSIQVNWRRPELVQSETDKVNILKQKLESGLISPIEAIQFDRNLSRDEAEKVYNRILLDNGLIPEVENNLDNNLYIEEET
jgi:hypothetical protein